MQRDKSFNNNILFKFVDAVTLIRKKIPTGEYVLDQNENTYSFLIKLFAGNYVTRKITIPEGMTVNKIIECLNQEPFLLGEITDIPSEGSIMPDTYYYKFGNTRQNIINRMRDEMNKFKRQVYSSNKTKLNWNEIVILGSLIELEAGHDRDRPIISSVLHNRLKKGQRLECCPTIIYALSINGKPIDRTQILYKDLYFKSPYNTYRNKGLPPTPICCPGRASILAAMKPDNTKYFFYISDIKTKETFYSENLEQHNKYKVMLKKRKSH